MCPWGGGTALPEDLLEPVSAVLIALASGAAAAALAGALTAGWMRRRLAAERAAAAARLDSAPVGLWRRVGAEARWTLSAGGGALIDLDPSIDPTPAAVLDRFRSDRRRTLSEALDALIEHGTPFDLTTDTADGSRTLELRGRQVGGDGLVWLIDQSEAALLGDSLAERDQGIRLLRGVLDSLPWPVWWRRAGDLDLAGCNPAYARTLETTPQAVVSGGHEIGGERGQELARRAGRTGVAQSESLYVVSAGARRLLDLTETPIEQVPGQLAGYAEDVSTLEELQETLGEHIAAHGEVLERLGAAIAIYAADKRMTFHNAAFLSLWGLPADRLEHSPTLGEVLEMLRERRALPEMVDFPAFKRQQDKLFTSLIEPREELLHLPDERTVRVSVSPHPQGGLLFVYEDVTDRVALERQHSTLTAVQRLTLDSLYEGVAVFGTDGRLRLSNDGFAKLFGFDSDWLVTCPHIAELAEIARGYLPETDDWESLRAKIVYAISEPKPRTGRMELRDEQIVDFAYVPLPDGQCLLLYLDVTDTVRVERALKERNAALENADLLKSQFISSISYELRSPLNAILGFTELLREEMFGPLNDRQREQVGHIHAATQDLAALINDVLDLAALQAGFLAIERKPIDLGRLIGEVAASAGRDAEQRGVGLETDFAEDLGTLHADERRLRQTVSRVVSSAIAYAPASTPVRMTAENSEGSVQLTISDPGHGLVASEGLFETGPATQDRTGRLTGAGVGLALCKNLMELHGGQLEVDPGEDDAPGRIIMRLPASSAGAKLADRGPGRPALVAGAGRGGRSPS